MFNALIWLDVTLWRWVTRGRYPMGETASAAAWRIKLQGRKRGEIAVWLIDTLFRPWQVNHCEDAYKWQAHIY